MPLVQAPPCPGALEVSARHAPRLCLGLLELVARLALRLGLGFRLALVHLEKGTHALGAALEPCLGTLHLVQAWAASTASTIVSGALVSFFASADLLAAIAVGDTFWINSFPLWTQAWIVIKGMTGSPRKLLALDSSHWSTWMPQLHPSL